MKNSLFFLSIMLLMLTSCTGLRKEGYSRISRGTYMRMITIGEGEKAAAGGDYISINMEYRTEGDSVFFRGMRRFRIENEGDRTGISKAFTGLHEGDSIALLLAVDEFFNTTLQRDVPEFLDPGSFMKMNFRIIKIQNRLEYEQEKKMFLSWAKELEKSEQDILRDYVAESQLDISPDESGMYFMKLEKGTGPEIDRGDHITIHYEGRFLDGKIFDSTFKREQALDFVYGTDQILVPGLQDAVGRMREGDHALAIMPSGLAFGRKGSLGGYIPPFTSLVFEVRVIKVE